MLPQEFNHRRSCNNLEGKLQLSGKDFRVELKFSSDWLGVCETRFEL